MVEINLPLVIGAVRHYRKETHVPVDQLSLLSLANSAMAALPDSSDCFNKYAGREMQMILTYVVKTNIGIAVVTDPRNGGKASAGARFDFELVNGSVEKRVDDASEVNVARVHLLRG